MRCPVCRAENDQGPSCRRCRADLALLFLLDDQRRRVLASARRCLHRGPWRRALVLAEGADTLRREAESQRLLALGYLLGRDFAQAWRHYRAAGGVESTETTNPTKKEAKTI